MDFSRHHAAPFHGLTVSSRYQRRTWDVDERWQSGTGYEAHGKHMLVDISKSFRKMKRWHLPRSCETTTLLRVWSFQIPISVKSPWTRCCCCCWNIKLWWRDTHVPVFCRVHCQLRKEELSHLSHDIFQTSAIRDRDRDRESTLDMVSYNSEASAKCAMEPYHQLGRDILASSSKWYPHMSRNGDGINTKENHRKWKREHHSHHVCDSGRGRTPIAIHNDRWDDMHRNYSNWISWRILTESFSK